MPPHGLVQGTDIYGILAEEKLLQRQHRLLGGKTRSKRSSRTALARAHQARIGINPHEGPDAAAAVGRFAPDYTGLHIGYFQALASCIRPQIGAHIDVAKMHRCIYPPQLGALRMTCFPAPEPHLVLAALVDPGHLRPGL